MGLGSGFVGVIAQWKRVCPWKIHIKIPWFVLMYGHELHPVESKCIAHLRPVMRMKTMLNSKDTLRFRHRKNFAWNFFRICDIKIVIKSQHQHEIRLGLRHSIAKTCKMMSERANLQRQTVLARCAWIYPGLCVSWYILYNSILLLACDIFNGNFKINCVCRRGKILVKRRKIWIQPLGIYYEISP